jgi:hypothetical protein
MRTTRALIAGFGTTGSLVAAVACVFVVASAVVAFNGWPSLGIGDRIDSLFVKDRPAVAFDAPGPQVVAGAASAAAGTVAAAPTGPVIAGRGIGGGPVGPGTNGSPRDGRAPGSGTSGDVQASVTPTGGGSGSGGDTSRPGLPDTSGATRAVGGAVQTTTHTAGDAVSGTINPVGQSVGSVNPPLGNTLSQTGGNIGTTVKGVGDSANTLLGAPR